MQIYIHIPFCVKKCFYCAFYSIAANANLIADYVDALVTEINLRANNEKISTIYFGGGTPSVLSIAQLQKIFSALHNNFQIDPNAEISIEVNPGTVTENFLRGLNQLGFNRLSIGVQSFNDNLLKIIGRIHDSETAVQTVQSAKKFFNNISVDLMFALPNQSLHDLKSSVDTAAALNVQHISVYGLEIEHDTKFFELQDKLNLPTDELSSDMYDFIADYLPAQGFFHYEISNFAKKNFESRHNIGYWSGKKYFGFGAAAHSFVGNLRTSNISDAESYTKKIFANEFVSNVEEVVSRAAAMEEFCFLGLRMSTGISEKNFFEKFGVNIFDVYGNVLQKYFKLGLLNYHGGQIFFSKRGFKLSNSILADFLL